MTTIGKTKNSTLRQSKIQEIVDKFEDARKPEHKYRVLRNAIVQLYPYLEEMPKDKVENMVYDIIQADREYRFATEDYNQIEKQKLSENWKIENGYR